MTNLEQNCPPRRAKPERGGFNQAAFLRDVVDATKNPRLLPSAIEAGDRTEFTREDVAEHCTEHSAWTIFKGTVYNMTPYLNYHPAGKEILMKQAAGKDCTEAFNAVHPYISMEGLLGHFKLGVVKEEKKGFLSLF